MSEKIAHTEPAGKQKNPYTIWFVVLSFVAPVALAYFIFYFVDVTSFTNHGDIYKPVVDVSELKLADSDGELLADKSLRYKWRFYSLVNKECGERCRNRLIEARQVHRSFGKNAHRIIRVVIYLEQPSPATEKFITSELPEAKIMYGSRDVIYNALNILEDRNEIFISDPMGNIMMRFRDDQPIKELQFDMKKLLHASQIG